jgi:prepilin-type N-terminal cleavage/methylation domain-containing protein/prepilin-type processing-associated H-X9-DG protein
MKTPRVPRAFTLLELLLVLAIIASLAGLLLPVIGNIRLKADATACQNNLRQIGIAAQLYAGEHEQTMPTIEPWPSEPVYTVSDGAQSLLDTLKPYGISENTLTCRTDLAGPNYKTKEGSSYEWCPMANGQNVQSVKMVWAGNVEEASLSKLLMAFDYSAVHSHRSNILFGDGHVATSD